MYEFIKLWVLPPASLWLLIAIGLAIQPKSRRTGTTLAWIGVILFYLASTTMISGLLVRTIQDNSQPRLTELVGMGAGAIVVLSAGMERDRPEYGGETIDAVTLERIRYAARVYRATGLPVLATGGVLKNTDMSVAVAMRDALQDDFGVPVKWVETEAQSTAENALFSARILKAENIDTIVLVTHAVHMRRSRAVFEAAGLKVIAAPTAFESFAAPEFEDFIPRLNALRDTYYAVYEMIGLAWYRISGQL